MLQLEANKLDFVPFYEPDVNQITAITITPNVLADKLTSYIPLANKVTGIIDKHLVDSE
jgi:hypothetical protein